MIDLLVLGAGISGLAVAREANARQLRTVVIDNANHIGGVLTTTVKHGVPLDHAAQSLAWSDKLASVFRSWTLDLHPIYADANARVRCIFRHGKIHSLQASPTTLFTTRLVSIRGRIRALKDLTLGAQILPPGSTLADVIAMRFGPEILSAIAVPVAHGIYGCHPARLDVDAVWPAARGHLLQHGSLIRGMLAARNSYKPRRTATFTGGMATLPQAIARGLDIRLNTYASLIAPVDGGWSVMCRSSDGREERLVSRRVVSTLAASAVCPLVAPLSPALASTIDAIPSSALTLHHAVFQPHVTAANLRAFGLLLAEGEHDTLLGILDPASTFPSLHNGYRHLTFFIQGTNPSAAEDAINFGMGLLGIRTLPLATHTVCWPHHIPIPTPGHTARMQAVDAFEREHLGLVLSGSWRHGVSIPSCINASRHTIDRITA